MQNVKGVLCDVASHYRVLRKYPAGRRPTPALVIFCAWIVRTSENEKHRRRAIDLHKHLERRGLLGPEDIFEGRRPKKNRWLFGHRFY